MAKPIFRTVHLKFSDDELAEIDVWQESQGIRTRSEAIRQMIKQTMRTEKVLAEPLIESELQRMVRTEVAKALLLHRKP